jgi:hypothetical protein
VKNLTKVNGSIEFCDAVMALAWEGRKVYARQSDRMGPTYRILAGVDARIGLEELFGAFGEDYPPVHMEDFAMALVTASKNGEAVPTVDVFTP